MTKDWNSYDRETNEKLLHFDKAIHFSCLRTSTKALNSRYFHTLFLSFHRIPRVLYYSVSDSPHSPSGSSITTFLPPAA